MTGLLDWIKTPEGQGLLSAAFGGLAGARRGAPLNSIGGAGMAGLMGYSGALDRQDRTAQEAQQRQLRDMQMKAAQFGLQKTERDMQTEEAIRAAAQGAYAPAMPGLGGLNSSLPAEMQTPMVPGKPAAFNTDQFLGQVMSIDPVRGMEWQAKFKKEPKYTVVDGNLVRTDTDKPTVAFTAPQKPEATPSAIREYQFAQGQGYAGTFDQWSKEQKRAGASSNSTNVTYGAPVAGIGPDGRPVFFQPPNRAGEPPQIIPGIQPPKIGDEMRERDQQRATTIQGVEDSLSVLDKAITHPGRATATGLSGAIDPRNYVPGTAARDFHVLKDQIGGKAFLQAFESLKGGGQITQVEGEKATAAIARLNTAQSDEEYRAALAEFRGIVAQGYQRMTGKPYQPKTREASGNLSAKPANGMPMKGQIVDGHKFKGGNPADPANWEKQ